MRISALNVHPIKGVRAVACDSSQVTKRGLAFDRRWLVVDADNKFQTQRNCAALAQVIATPTPDGIRLENAAMDAAIDVAFPMNGARRSVPVWSDHVNAVQADDEACAWLSKALEREVRLYFMDDEATRLSSEKWHEPGLVNFSDMYPVLIANTASLDALNQVIESSGGAPVGMERFRANIVVDGAEPWAEDFWKVIEIGDVVYDVVMPCDRCLVTTKDQQSGKTMGKEPLASLAKIRLSADPRINGVLFGWRAIPRSEGAIAVGDALTVLEARPEGWPLAIAS